MVESLFSITIPLDGPFIFHFNTQMSTMIELAVVVGEEVELEEVEVEVGEEGGGSDPGVVVDIGRKGTARDHNFRMKMEISQWMIGTARIFDCKVEASYNFVEVISWLCLFLVDLISPDHLPVGEERDLLEGPCSTDWVDLLKELLLV